MITPRDEEAYKKWLYNRDLTLPEAFSIYREELFPEPLKNYSCLIGRRGSEVFIDCETVEEAYKILDWLLNLGVDSTS